MYGGVNDPRMGNTFEKDHPGYFGHIELNRPVYHVGFLKYVKRLFACISANDCCLALFWRSCAA